MVVLAEAGAQTWAGHIKVDHLGVGLPFDAGRCRVPDATVACPPGKAHSGGLFTPCLPAFPMTSALAMANARDAGDGADVKAEASNEKLDGESRQITPIFIPGIQDHYTGFKEELHKVQVHPDTDGKVSDVEIARHDRDKLESLIWLYLATNKGDDASPSGASEPCKPPSDGIDSERFPDHVQDAEECATPPALPDNSTFSRGSVGHPETCKEPCKYNRKKRGCKDGFACTRCHLCTWHHKRNPN